MNPTASFTNLRKQIDQGKPREIIDRNMKLVARLSKENEELPSEGDGGSVGARIIPDPKHPKRGHDQRYMN